MGAKWDELAVKSFFFTLIWEITITWYLANYYFFRYCLPNKKKFFITPVMSRPNVTLLDGLFLSQIKWHKFNFFTQCAYRLEIAVSKFGLKFIISFETISVLVKTVFLYFFHTFLNIAQETLDILKPEFFTWENVKIPIRITFVLLNFFL